MSARTVRTRRWFARSAVVGLAVAACGSGDDPAGSDGSAAPPASPGTTAPPTTDPATEPAPTEPPATEPLATEPPTTEPPAPAGPTCTPAPDGVTSFVTGPDWTAGTERRLELTRQRSTNPGRGVTPVAFAVIEERPDGWQMSWTAGVTDLVGIDVTPDEQAAVDELLEGFEQPQILYGLDSTRVFLGVENPDELRVTMTAVLDLFADLFEPEALRAVTDLFGSLDDEDLGQLLSEDTQLYHGLEGWELDVGTPIEFPDVLPNALGGPPFPATTTVEIVDLVGADGCVVVQMVVVPDADEVGAIITETLAAQGFPADSVPRELANLSVENRIVASYGYESGYLARVDATQEIRVGSEVRVDARTIVDATDG